MGTEQSRDRRADDPAALADAGTLKPRRRWDPTLAVAFVALLVDALAVSWLALRGRPLAWDEPVLRWVQRAPAWTVPLAEGLSWIGLFVPSLVLAVLTAGWLWRFGARWPAVVVIAAALLHGLNRPMKALVDRPRPTSDLATIIEHAQGYGFPSGHSFGAMVLFPVLAAALGVLMRPGWGRWLAQGLLILIAFGIGWSRVRLGAHWPSDVLGGWLWGGAVALALLAGFLRVAPRPEPRDAPAATAARR